MEIAFKSLGGQDANQGLILAALDRLADDVRPGSTCTLQIMCFAFTDQVIAAKLLDVVSRNPRIQVKILADWSQRSPFSASVLPDMAENGTPGIAIKYKIDLPYRLSRTTGQPEWDYLSSFGMLHHKTMLAVVNDQPHLLTFGSFNWSARGRQAYENTVLLERTADTAHVLAGFFDEFTTLWNDPTQTADADTSLWIANKARAMLLDGVDLKAHDSKAALLGGFTRPMLKSYPPQIQDGPVLSAFSAHHILDDGPTRGAGPTNQAQKINLLRPSGNRKPAPLTLNTLALDAIRCVPDGEEICIAMYAMSPSVPEYEALLEAARRGCPLRVLLDQKIGGGFAGDLARKAHLERLPISVKATRRRMHQKYILSNATQTVAVGTANMTRDATSRHFENRVLFRNVQPIADRFANDFEMIWDRIH